MRVKSPYRKRRGREETRRGNTLALRNIARAVCRGSRFRSPRRRHPLDVSDASIIFVIAVCKLKFIATLPPRSQSRSNTRGSGVDPRGRTGRFNLSSDNARRLVVPILVVPIPWLGSRARARAWKREPVRRRNRWTELTSYARYTLERDDKAKRTRTREKRGRWKRAGGREGGRGSRGCDYALRIARRDARRDNGYLH